MSFQFSDLAIRIREKGVISAEDTLAIRRWEWEDGAITRKEADLLFDLNDLAKTSSPEWVDCFVEAISVYIVDQEHPRGYVSEENAAWLIGRVDKDGRVDTQGELELIVRVLEKALNAPDSLKAYALKQIENTVLTGEGPTRKGSEIHAGQIDEAEVELLRRIVFASGGSGPGVVSQDEAEVLFRLKDATLGATNGAGWKQLFVQAVGNHLKAHSSYHQFSRDEAIQRDAFMNDTRTSPLSLILRTFHRPDFDGAGSDVFDNSEEDEIALRKKAEATSNAVTGSENAWLNNKIEADHQLDEFEQAVLDFIRAG